MYFIFILFASISVANSSEKVPCAQTDVLKEFIEKPHYFGRRLSYLDQMVPENLDFVRESVRTELEVNERAVNRMKGYLNNMRLAAIDFDDRFRSGQMSKEFREGLKKEHRLLSLGAKNQSHAYIGTTSANANSILTPTEENVELFFYEQPKLKNPPAVVLELMKKPRQPADNPFLPKDYVIAEDPWKGPGPNLIPPPNMPGPFPKKGETWELWLPEIVARAKQNSAEDPKMILPKNFNQTGKPLHQYPPFSKFSQEIYLDEMQSTMQKIEQSIGRNETQRLGTQAKVGLLSHYYQIGINAHLFTRVNNSLLMNHVNYLLHFMGMHGVPHGKLDYLAFYKLPADFDELFWQEVRKRNPDLH